MHTGSDQHRLTCSMSMKYCCRKFKFPVCKLQFSVPLLTRFYGNIFQMKRISLSACQKKDWRRTIVDDLFLRPDLFPDIFVTGNIQKSCLSHRFLIPFWTFQTTQRNLARDLFHLLDVRATVVILYILLFCLLTILLVSAAFLFII